MRVYDINNYYKLLIINNNSDWNSMDLTLVMLEQIKCIRPKVIVALGTTAVEGLLGKKTLGITRLRGKFDDFRGIPLMPTYHPSYVLRNPANRIKRQIWEDMLSVMRLLNHPVTSQQENYFTS